MQERKIINKSALNYYITKYVSALTNYTLKKYEKAEIKVNIFLLWATVGGEWLTSCSSNLPLRNSTQHTTDESQSQSDTHVHVRNTHIIEYTVLFKYLYEIEEILEIIRITEN